MLDLAAVVPVMSETNEIFRRGTGLVFLLALFLALITPAGKRTAPATNHPMA